MDTHIDYLRIASWQSNAFVNTMAILMDGKSKEWERGKWLQYVGWRKEGVFVGRGEQRHKVHTLINISGYLAQDMYQFCVGLVGWYCTRIDLQRTIKTPLADDEQLALVRDDCTTKNKTLIESEENDTLYLGSRTSDLFTRLYEKILEDKYLRLEFELKGYRSRAVWDALKTGETADKIFFYYLEKSALPEQIKDHYRRAGDIATEKVMRLQIEHDEEKKLAWVMTLDASMSKNMASHGIGEQVKIIVRRWASYADYLDMAQIPD
jgi:hypothetical protein